MHFSIEPIDLQLKDRFTTHIDSRVVQHSHIIRIEEEGLVGIGEVTAHPFYKISREKILADFFRVKEKFDGAKYDGPETLWQMLSDELKENTFLLSGLDVASNDLHGKRKGLPLHKLWGADSDFLKLPISSYTIGIDTPEKMLVKMKKMPWSNYKIKLGTAEDISILKLLRTETKVPFRLDANCAWDCKTLIKMNKILSSLNIEFIEQPIHPDRKDEIKLAKGQSHWELAADESFKTMDDLEFCAENFDILNIKLVKCGGLTPARRIINKAKTLGMKIMVGCMTESSISISAAAQLLPWVDYADLDGALLITNDVGTGAKIKADRSQIGNGAGIGFIM